MNINYAINAAARFLVRRGYEIEEINEESNIQIVALDDECLVFVSVKVCADGFATENTISRKEFETVAIDYLTDHAAEERQVRFDNIGVIVLSPDRAMLRHHINALGVA